MAEEQAQERTEAATPRRLEKAREEGQVARSRDFAMAVLMLVASLGVIASAERLLRLFGELMRFNFRLERSLLFDSSSLVSHLGGSIWQAAVAVVPLLALLFLASLLGPLAIGGWSVSSKALMPRFNRLDPFAGLKRMFAMRAWVDLLKALAKFLFVTAMTLWLLYRWRSAFHTLGDLPLRPAIGEALHLLGVSFVVLCSSLVLIGLADIPWQLFEYQKQLKMTKQDVREEAKESEGKPEVKGRIRQLQREFARNRMMAEVPTADVIITNPTHFAVALRYDAERMGAPRLVAKGSDALAMKIREIAQEHGVPIVELPALARAIHHHTEINQEIPAGLYLGVAQVLAYIFQLRRQQQSGGKKPTPPQEVPIPDELRRD